MDSNLFWCIVGIVGGAIFSLIISLIFYLIGLKKKKISYEIETSCLILNEVSLIDNLEIKYNTNTIKNLYSSSITIINSGNSIIDKNDFSLSNPLSFITNGEFLINKTNKTNLINSNKNENLNVTLIEENARIRKLNIEFDYISKNEFITFTVFHTDNIFFNGKLKDGKIINLNNNSKYKLFFINLINKYLAYLYAFIGTISGSFSAFYFIYNINCTNDLYTSIAITLLCILAVILLSR